MACGCKKRGGSRPVPTGSAPHTVRSSFADIPHEVLPGESCIFCAEKHLSAAYVELMRKGMSIGAVIGELELARRHTVEEFIQIADTIAILLVQASARININELATMLQPILATVTKTAEKENPDIAVENEQYVLPSDIIQVANPLIGELHLCAAYRLAFEVGYMMNNRYMIIGDLTLAREHFVRFDAEISAGTREIRHRIQATRATDINKSWPLLVSRAGTVIEKNLEDHRSRHLSGLRSYVGLPSDDQHPAE